jgi:predicted nucleic acid-binding protein
MRETDKESTYIGTHPFEVYYQDNEFQDYMSVGCYDFLKDEWLVGPELIDQSFNPYSEYYKEVQEKSESMANNIRNTIFSIYEIAIVLKKNINTDFGNNIRSVFVSKLEEAKTLYENIRQMRKVYSSPESVEQALKYRSSRKWKIADASFKLFDKYGYMAILKQFVESYDLI